LSLTAIAGFRSSRHCSAFPADIIAKITPRAAAIWYLDNGTLKRAKKYGHGSYSISTKKLPFAQLEAIAYHFEKIGMGRTTLREGHGLIWHGERSKLFAKAIAPFVPECMGYKLGRLIDVRCKTMPARMELHDRWRYSLAAQTESEAVGDVVCGVTRLATATRDSPSGDRLASAAPN
jgi:hypothetical protein